MSDVICGVCGDSGSLDTVITVEGVRESVLRYVDVKLGPLSVLTEVGAATCDDVDLTLLDGWSDNVVRGVNIRLSSLCVTTEVTFSDACPTCFVRVGLSSLGVSMTGDDGTTLSGVGSTSLGVSTREAEGDDIIVGSC